ncbi:MAG: thioredoxin-dependent thiol peroxidase [bacterium]|nr:thioredoxin-dependent thiol peroxidase [bacterium]
MKLKIGEKAPGFKLPDQNNEIRSLAHYAGKWVLLYFYPKDDTPGCTQEACAIRDDFFNFEKINVTVLGVSTDSVKSHKKFEEKYHLPFTLLADEKKEVVEKYDVWTEKKFMGRKYMGTLRTSFLIDPKGKIAKIYEDVKPIQHSAEVLADLKTLQRD